ncbi:RagB/SusD family nutrient uptake outer membrane protein [uncultured Algibacter sp.]|uniref:RagB/SusD family nutrient uptake outer membrane protein n=1 Tax=uncultured Algibacter sp. TaxID=298659 RepID=UPI0032175684
MKLLKYIIVPLLTIAFVTSSCTRDNYLDEVVPRGVVIPSTIEDYRLLLDNVTPDDLGNALPISFGFDEKHSISSYMTDDHVIPNDLSQTLQGPQRRAYLFGDAVYIGNEQDPDWNFYYNQIYTANIILEGLESVDNGTADDIAELQAEAKIHRAYAYFNLVNLYGLHYNPVTADTDLGVPIRQGTALENLDFTRASVQTVYDLIIQDITTSINSLQDTQSLNFTFRPSKAGAYGFLSKVYLYQGRYDLALDAVDNALNIYNVLRDINDDESDPFTSALNSPAVIQDPQIVWYKQAQSVIFVSDAILSEYNFDDIRAFWFTRDAIVTGSQENALLFTRNVNQNFSDGINTPELYLIRAECHTRLMNLALANNDLNTLREKRFFSGSSTPINITNQDELLAFVKKERRLELIGNYDRLFDIKRYNLFDNDNISITHTLESISATLEANSLNWALPIAEIYIQQNPEIQQNPRD